MKTVFWVTAFALALLRGADCSKFTVPMLGAHRMYNMDTILESLKVHSSRYAAVDNIVTAIYRNVLHTKSLAKELDIVVHTGDTDFTEVRLDNECVIPHFSVHRRMSTEKNETEIKSYLALNIIQSIPPKVKFRCIEFRVVIPEGANLLYIPDYGVMWVHRPMVYVARMRGPAEHKFIVCPYGDKSGNIGSPYSSVDQIGYFINIDRYLADDLLHKIWQLYGEESYVTDFGLQAYGVHQLGQLGTHGKSLEEEVIPAD